MNETSPRESAVSKTIYVGNLNPSISREDLEQMFGRFGCVESAFLPLDSLGRSKGIGYVTFADADSAEEAVSVWHLAEVAGRTLRINYAAEPSRIPDSGH
ncbi:RNA recognition motif domain-containing protein [Streptomyces sp. NPDC055287]